MIHAPCRYRVVWNWISLVRLPLPGLSFTIPDLSDESTFVSSHWKYCQYALISLATSLVVTPGAIASRHAHLTGGHLGRARILLADDHLDSLETVERHLKPEFDVVGKVRDGQLLLEEAMRLKPDVIVSDISMPLLNGIEAADQLKESDCRSRIVFLTVHTDSDFVRRCLSAGAFGYVVKSRIGTELVPAIREALAGHIFISNHLAGRYP